MRAFSSSNMDCSQVPIGPNDQIQDLFGVRAMSMDPLSNIGLLPRAGSALPMFNGLPPLPPRSGGFSAFGGFGGYGFDRNPLPEPKVMPATKPLVSKKESAAASDADDVIGPVEEPTVFTSSHCIQEFQGKLIGNYTFDAFTPNPAKGDGKDIYLVFDFSGSMSTVRAQSIEILKKIIDAITQDDRLSIILFDDTVTQLFGLQPMVREVKENLKNKLNGIGLGGGTDFGVAFRFLHKVMTAPDTYYPERPQVVIFLSDGQSQGAEAVQSIYDLARNTEIYSMSFGQDVKADVLRSILREHNQENYYQVDTVDGFFDLVGQIGLESSQVKAKNLKITFSGVRPLSSFAKLDEATGQYVISLPTVKDQEVFSMPIEVTGAPDSIKITAELVGLDGQLVQLPLLMNQLDASYVSTYYNYKKTMERVLEISTGPGTNQEKLQLATELEATINLEHFGVFLDETRELVRKLKSSFIVTHGFGASNAYASAQMRQYSDRSPTVSMAFRTVSDQVYQRAPSSAMSTN